MRGIPVLKKYRYLLYFKLYDIIILLISVFHTLLFFSFFRDIRPSMVTHTRNLCSAFTHPKCTHTAVNTHTPWTHTRSSGKPFMLRRPGSSWGFGVLLKGTSVTASTRVLQYLCSLTNRVSAIHTYRAKRNMQDSYLNHLFAFNIHIH